ncbi:CHAT domain-containing protein [Ephemerocybe angulata]|uniref:CHAT domain-containing protein n=1 Tax=Ephemerocybe angulata TaxID=980116 RepID=A0A8H6M0P8_9AGAR|nr:CHAT domain-containing protein [Tulosesus angulatus]
MTSKNRLCLTEIAIQRTEAVIEYRANLNLTELWIAGISTSPGGQCFVLTRVGPRRWERKGSIEISDELSSLVCILKAEDGKEAGLVHLNVTEMKESDGNSQNGFSQEVRMRDAKVKLGISWNLLCVPIEIKPVSDEDALRLDNFAIELYRRYMQSGHPAEFDKVIQVQRKAVELTPLTHVRLPHRLAMLGTSLMDSFGRTGDLLSVNEAITVQKRAVELTPGDNPILIHRLTDLGLSLKHRFGRTGSLSDISEAILVQRRAEELLYDGHSALPAILNNLGNSLRRRFEYTGDLSDLAEAIISLEKAVKLTPAGHADLPGALNSLGSSYGRRFGVTGALPDINMAISAQGKAVELTPEHHPSLGDMLSNLGFSMQSRFQHTGNVPDITGAISAHRRALKLRPEGHPNRGSILTNLGNSLLARFGRDGDLADVSEAILMLQKAAHCTPAGHSILPLVLKHLGSAFLRRFDRSENLDDIFEAIATQQKALALLPQGHADMPSLLGGLGTTYMRLFERTQIIEDIDKAIPANQKAVELTPPGHADLPLRLSNLGNAFSLRFEKAKNVSDIIQAVSAQRGAIELTPEAHKDLPTMLNNLGIACKHRFDNTGNPADLDEAIAAQKRSVALTPDGHADFSFRARNLGKFLHVRFISGGDTKDLEESIGVYRLGATCDIGSPWERLLGAVKWAQLLRQYHPQSPEILLAFDVAVHLGALKAGLEHTVQGRYSQLETKAAAAAFELDRTDKALEWLEQGRCLVWSQLNNLRTPLDELRIHDSELAQRVSDLSQLLETAGSSRVSSYSGMSLSEKLDVEDGAHAHLKLAKEWDDLLKTVRAIPNFESFLKPPSISTILHHIPDEGHIVIINVDSRRCDAIALRAGLEPLHIPLPDFTFDKGKRYQGVLGDRLRHEGLRARGGDVTGPTEGDVPERSFRRARPGHSSDDTLQYVLRCLWVEVVKPILTALGVMEVDRQSQPRLPRIWWCPTGILSFLPIHAAGIYDRVKSEGTLDYVVSSYIPNVAALTDRVKNSHPVDSIVAGLFLTSQPDAPNASSIPGTTQEVRGIHSRAIQAGTKVLKVEGSALSVDSCLKHMEEFSSVHFACHAHQNAADPLQSSFLLHMGCLDLATIIRSNLKKADLAFLSACQTSTGEEKLSDEAVHLAAGMLAAGYRRVVATMWSIGDDHAQRVACDFYEYIWKHGEGASDGGFDGSKSAYALHHATQQLRLCLDTSDSSLFTWVPFVHFGY